MKKLNGKIFLFVGVAVLVLCANLFLSNFVQAQAVTTSTLGLSYGSGTGLGSADLRVVVANIIRIALGLLGILLVILALYAGFLWATSMGESDKIEKAKKLLVSAVIGLVIILTSYAIASFVLNKLVTATTTTGAGDGGGGGGGGNGGGGNNNSFQVRDIQPRGQLKIRNVVVRVTLSQPLANNFFDGEGATKTPVIVEKIKADGSGELVPGNLTIVQGSPRQVLFTPSTPCKNQQGEDLAIKCFAYEEFDPANPIPNLNHYRITINTVAKDAFINEGFINEAGVREQKTVTCLGKTCQAEFIVGAKIDEILPTISWNRAISGQGENKQEINLNNQNVALLSQSTLYNLTAQASDLTGNVDDVVSGIAGVDFYFDTLTAEDSPSTTVDNFVAGFDLDTAPYKLKQVYDLKARAYDVAGNYSNFKIKQVRLLAGHCFNNKKDADEVKVDCDGADCDPCKILPEHCSNNRKDVDEGGKDCGGADCDPCKILPEHCSNNRKDADEVKIDCGGADCDPCADEPPAKKGYYEWQFTTCLDCVAPAVVENNNCLTELASPTPLKDSLSTSADTLISATFNTTMAEDSFVLGDTVKVEKCGNQNQPQICVNFNIAGSFKFGISGSSYGYFILTPDKPLEVGSWYKVILSTGLKGDNKENLSLVEDYSWYFKVKQKNCEATTVRVSPANRLDNPANPKDQPIFLGEKVWYDAISSDNYCNICPDTLAWKWSSSDQGKATINDKFLSSRSLLTASGITEKTATITATTIIKETTLSASARVDIVAPSPRVVFDEFCTAQLSSPSPYVNKDNACPNGAISVRFTTAMDGASLQAKNALILKQVLGNNQFKDIALQNISLLHNLNNEVTGLEIWPTENLATSTKFAVILNSNTKSIYNRFLAGKTQWEFTTARENCAADATLVEPADNKIAFDSVANYNSKLVDIAACQTINKPNGEWIWETENQNIATVEPSKTAEAKVSSKKQNGVTRVIAKFGVLDNRNIGSNGRLLVGQNAWEITNNFPAGDNVCTNALGQVIFNMPISEEAVLKDQVGVFVGKGITRTKGLLEIERLVNNNGFIFKLPNRANWATGVTFVVEIKGGENGLRSADNQIIDANNCLNVAGKTSGLVWDKDAQICSWQFTVGDGVCGVDHVKIVPAEKTILEREATRLMAFPFTLDGKPLSADLVWSVNDPTIAKLELNDSNNFATTTALKVGETEVLASSKNGQGVNIVGTSRLTVLPALITPKIIRTEPDKDEQGKDAVNVCPNSIVLLDVDQQVDPKTISTSTLQIGELSGEGFKPLDNLGEWKVENNIYNNTARIKFLLKQTLPLNKQIQVRIIGDIRGLNKLLLDKNNHVPFTFTTANNVCKLNFVTVTANEENNSSEWVFSSLENNINDDDPDSTTFDSVNDDRDKKFVATGYTIDNQILTPVPSYDWSWQWNTDNQKVAGVIYSSSGVAVIAAQKENGATKITATADFGQAGRANNRTGAGKAVVDVCLNRWDPNNDKTGLWTDDRFGYSLSYCRDFGGDGKNDDLPAIEISLKTNKPRSDADKTGLLKEYLLSLPMSGDLIGLRIYDNPKGLTPGDWFVEQGFKGASKSLTVDGYSALEEGRTMYVAANQVLLNNEDLGLGDGGGAEGKLSFNSSFFGNLWSVIKNLFASLLNKAEAAEIDPASQINSIENFIFLISYNQTNDPRTLEIVKRLKRGLTFNNNLKDSPILKTKIQRDGKRLTDVRNILVALENYYKNNKNIYPALNSGSFLKGMSFSSWPSWNQVLAKNLGITLPKDPLNQFGACLKCEEPQLKNGGFESDWQLWTWAAVVGRVVANSNSDYIKEGKESLFVNVKGGALNLNQKGISLTSNVSYEATVQVYINSGRVTLTLGDAVLNNEAITPPDYKGWITLKSRYTPTENNNKGIITINNFDGQPAIFYVDDAKIKSVSGNCGYDSNTCWNPIANEGKGNFVCSADNSYFYHYQVKGQNNYFFTAQLEAVNAQTWSSWWASLSAVVPSLGSKVKLSAEPLSLASVCKGKATVSWCGDGIRGVDENGLLEQCEPGEFYDYCNSDVFGQNNYKWYKPNLVGCKSDCTWEIAQPTSEDQVKNKCGGWCGDGISNPGEECDASIAGYVGGGTKVSDQYACSNNCRALGGWCGDNVVQSQYDEVCDGNQIVGYDCPGDNEPSCATDCRSIVCKDSIGNIINGIKSYEGRCGNNIVEPGEKCDICSPFNTDECLGTFEGAQYKCNNKTCTFEGGYCGDKIWKTEENFEGCEKTKGELSLTFENYGYSGGKSAADQYKCSAKCQDIGGWCGDGVWQTEINPSTDKKFEECDGSVKTGAKGFGGGKDDGDQYLCSSDCKKTEGGYCGDTRVQTGFEDFDFDKNTGDIFIIPEVGPTEFDISTGLTSAISSRLEVEGKMDCLGMILSAQNSTSTSGIYNFTTCKMACPTGTKAYQGECGNSKKGELEGLETCELKSFRREGPLNENTSAGGEKWSCFRSTTVENGIEIAKLNNTLTCNGCVAECAPTNGNGKRGTAYKGFCGNNTKEGPEECDKGDFGGDSCRARGAASGDLVCKDDCTIDTSKCIVNLPTCGNNRKEKGEECDGRDFGGVTKCTDVIENNTVADNKYEYGNMNCNLNCQTSCYNYNCVRVVPLNPNSPCQKDGDDKLICNGGWGDCDGKAVNGCEVNLTTNLYDGFKYNSNGSLMNYAYNYYKSLSSETCGVCNKKTTNATCNSGVFECKEGFANCDGDFSNGCESRISKELMDGRHFTCNQEGKIVCTGDYVDCIGFNFKAYLSNAPTLNLLKKKIECPSKECEDALVNVLLVEKKEQNKDLFNGCSVYTERDQNNVIASCCGTPIKANTQCSVIPSKNLICVPGYAACNGALINNSGCQTKLGVSKNCSACNDDCANRFGPFATCKNDNGVYQCQR